MNSRKRKADAIPGGGGGPNSAHRLFSQKMAERQAGRLTASLKGGVTFGITSGAYQLAGHDAPPSQTGTSIFDPTLCELCYRWFCPPGGVVWSPFMGESSIGLVASRLGLRYFGMDVRAEQAAANKMQSDKICRDYPEPQWLVGDSADADVKVLCSGQVDFVFACPPYADLEVYSSDPRDLSTMDYPAFLKVYRKIIAKSCAAMKPDRFACFVVGEVRGKDGNYYGFVPDTVRAFMDAGLGYYNEAILITAAGSLPVRTRRQFEIARKLGKTHQNVLIFCKGDARKATAAVGAVEFGEFPDDGEALNGA